MGFGVLGWSMGYGVGVWGKKGGVVEGWVREIATEYGR